MPGYYGFLSRKAYEDHYSDPAKYADEIPAMEAYAREAEADRSGGNVAHYELERRLTDKIWTADDKELRTAIVLFVKDASVATVNELAIRLGVPRT